MSKLKYIQLFIFVGLSFQCREDVPVEPVFNLAQESAIDEDDYLIYSQIIEEYHSYGDKPLAIIQETFGGVADLDFHKAFASDYEYFDSTIVENLITTNDTVYYLGYNFSSTIEIKLISNDELEYVNEKDQWFTFNQKYLDILMFSRVGYNKDKTQALVEYSRNYSGHIVWLIETDGRWKVDKYILTWIS